MGKHDIYGKDLMNSILGKRFNKKYTIDKCCIKISFDGVIKDDSGKDLCVVEIESRVDKQVRGGNNGFIVMPIR